MTLCGIVPVDHIYLFQESEKFRILRFAVGLVPLIVRLLSTMEVSVTPFMSQTRFFEVVFFPRQVIICSAKFIML